MTRISNRWMQFAWMALSGTAILLVLLVISEDSYLLFHSLMETFSIIVAASIFMIAWNARGYMDNDYLLFIGVAYFFTSIIDMLHMLAYHGMGVFATSTGSNLATQLWVAGRYLQGVTLLLAPIFCNRKLNVQYQIAIYSVVTGLLLTSIFYWKVFPVSYVESSGLTPFKIASEYIVIAMLLGAILLLYLQRKWFDRDVLYLMTGSLFAAITAEFAFTAYINVYSGTSAIGHLLRLISFYLAYKAIVETGLVKPQALMFRNLTRSEEQLRQQTIELQKRNEELDTFAHTVAHDLKNPLSTIIVIVDTLSSVKMRPKDWSEFSHDLKSTAYEMNRIIDNLLLLAEVRRNELSLGEVDMAEVVARVQIRLRQLILKSKATIIAPKQWPLALGYEPWVDEVLANYVSNAIKYGGEPPVIHLGVDTYSSGELRFWVQDNGRGISPQEQENLFKPFSQLHHRKLGHGLGLSIVRHIVERMGGRVGVDSTPEKGSRFYFTLSQLPEKVKEEGDLSLLAATGS